MSGVHTSLPAGVALRAAVPSDAEAGASLHIACWREAYGPLTEPALLEPRLADTERWVGACPWRVPAAIGERPCSLWALESNDRAQAFYAHNGFVADGARELYESLDTWEVRMVRPSGTIST